MADGLNLGKQVGPLPLGAWIAVVAGGLGIAFMINRNQKASDDGSFIDPDSDVGQGGNQLIYDPPTNVPAPDTKPTDNAEWARQGTAHAIGLGFNPGVSWNALQKFISGEQLNGQEQEIVNRVIRDLGPPPEPISPVDTVPQPPNTPPTKPDTPKPIPRPPGKPVSTPGWSNDVPLSIRVAFPASRVKAVLGAVGHKNTGTHLNLSDLKRGFQLIGHNYGTTVNVSDVALLVSQGATSQTKFVTTVTQKPRGRVRAGVPFTVSGRVTANGRPYNGVVYIARKGPGYPNFGFLAYTACVAGRWTFRTAVGGRAGRTWTFRFGVGPGANRSDNTDIVAVQT